MTFLDELSPEKRDMIVSLPYRVGLWVSQSDSSGGAASDAQEQQALSSILHAYSQEIFGSETVQHVISATIAQQSDWPRWGKNMADVMVDCRNAVKLLSGLVDPKELSAFKQHLVEIGEAVALAFRENNETLTLGQKIPLYLEYLKSRARAARAKKRFKSFEEFLNISAGERRALSTLAEALGSSYI